MHIAARPLRLGPTSDVPVPEKRTGVWEPLPQTGAAWFAARSRVAAPGTPSSKSHLRMGFQATFRATSGNRIV